MNAEERRTYRRERYAKQREHILAQNREWKRDNGDKINRPLLSSTERDIIAVDGEGISTEKWYHHTRKGTVVETIGPMDREWRKWRNASIWSAQEQIYTLLAASNHTKVTNPKGLSTRECLDFLLTLGKTNRIVVGFSLSYDVNMWLRDLPEERLKRIQKWNNIKWKDYTLTWIRRKQFSITKGKQSVTVWDIFGYCQSRFVDALRDWQVADESTIDIIDKMKAKRGEFAQESESDIEDYTFLECELCVKLMRKILECAKGVNIVLSRYDGAGSLAAALMRTHHIDEYIQSPKWLDSYGLGAYYGGRFEMAAPGIYQELYSYDINSAYPSALVEAPCLTHSEWSYYEEWNGSNYALVHVVWDISEVTRDNLPGTFGPFPYRNERGSISYPLRGKGWYWGTEVNAAIKLYGMAIRIVESYCLTQRCTDQPFQWLNELYDHRKQLKKRGDLGHLILKLGINSCYGKTAQNVGGRGHEPKYRNWLIASWTTAHCRAHILDAIRLSNGAVISIATDGVLSTRSIDGLTLGNGLGEWESGYLTNGFLIRPNLYGYTDGNKRIIKCGGLAKKETNIDALYESFREEGPNAHYQVILHRFMGLGAALARNALDSGHCCWIEQNYLIGPSQHNRLHMSAELSPPYDRLNTVPLLGELSTDSYPFQPKVSWTEAYEDVFDDLSMLLDVPD